MNSNFLQTDFRWTDRMILARRLSYLENSLMPFFSEVPAHAHRSRVLYEFCESIYPRVEFMSLCAVLARRTEFGCTLLLLKVLKDHRTTNFQVTLLKWASNKYQIANSDCRTLKAGFYCFLNHFHCSYRSTILLKTALSQLWYNEEHKSRSYIHLGVVEDNDSIPIKRVENI